MRLGTSSSRAPLCSMCACSRQLLVRLPSTYSVVRRIPVGYVSTIEALKDCAILYCDRVAGLLYGTQRTDQLIRVDGLATPLRAVISVFVRDVLLPCLDGVLPKGVLEIIAAYKLLY